MGKGLSRRIRGISRLVIKIINVKKRRYLKLQVVLNPNAEAYATKGLILCGAS
jgi:hypothetical protein